MGEHENEYEDVVSVGTWTTTRLQVGDTHGKKTLRADVFHSGGTVNIEMRNKSNEVIGSMRMNHADLAEFIDTMRPLLMAGDGEEGSG